MPQGFCLECNLPLGISTSTGYHSFCAEIAHERSQKEIYMKYPFVILDSFDNEIERFETEAEADEFLYKMKNLKICQ